MFCDFYRSYFSEYLNLSLICHILINTSILLQNCLHNTIGENCEICAAGYFGDATNGNPDDCKPCHCPLPLGENDFIPKCIVDAETKSVQCLCPRGYEGPRCER